HRMDRKTRSRRSVTDIERMTAPIRWRVAGYTLIHQRHLTPSCRGQALLRREPWTRQGLLREGLNPGPELENSQGHFRKSAEITDTSALTPKSRPITDIATLQLCANRRPMALKVLDQWLGGAGLENADCDQRRNSGADH